MIKQKAAIILSVTMTFLFSIPVEAGPLRWIKEGFEYVTDKKAKDSVREQAAAEARRRAQQQLALKAKNSASKAVARQATTNQLGRVSTAFQVGAYTFTGTMIFSTLAQNGYAASDTTFENEEVAVEIATAVADNKSTFYEKFCFHPRTGEQYVVPSWTNSCGDGKTPSQGTGILLDTLRSEARL